MNWGHELCMHRKALHLTQEDLAERMGVSSRTISFWETGQRGMTLQHAELAFGVLGIEFTLKRKIK